MDWQQTSVRHVAFRPLHLCGAVLLLLALTGCTVPHPYSVSSGSMSPFIKSGDRIFIDQSQAARSDIHDGDVIAFRREPDFVIIKRIAAMSGETILGRDRKVFRNGKLVPQPYLAPADQEAIMPDFPARTIPPGELFVLGDNRDYSLDSRAPGYAPVKLTDVIGKYTWTYWRTPAKPD